MQICILDGTPANPGDLSWAPIEALGELTVYEFTEPEEVIPRAMGAEILLTNKTILTDAMIKTLHQNGLRYIGTLSTGYNVLNPKTAADLGIPVCNIPDFCTQSVAQYVFAMILHLTNRIGVQNESVHQGDWCRSRHFSYWDGDFTELWGKKLGILGYGAIGKAVAKIGTAMGMEVLVCTRTPKKLQEGCRSVDQDTLFRESDFLSLHCPLTEQTAQIIHAATLSQMKPTAVLINTGRGGLIDEAALAAALNSGKIAAAGLDVLSTEPPHPENPLLSAKNCIITPHTAWASSAARSRLIQIAAENIRAFLNGTIQNQVAF